MGFLSWQWHRELDRQECLLLGSHRKRRGFPRLLCLLKCFLRLLELPLVPAAARYPRGGGTHVFLDAGHAEPSQDGEADRDGAHLRVVD